MNTEPPKRLYRYANDFSVGAVCVDFQDAETGLRGVVLRGPFSFCAYVGAPENHALYELAELEFSCHYGITYTGPGTDLVTGEEGWYFFGWDYAHAWDQMAFEGHDELCREMADQQMPPDIAEAFKRLGMGRPRAKRWTVEEVTEDLFDALLELKHALARSRGYSQALRSNTRTFAGPAAPS